MSYYLKAHWKCLFWVILFQVLVCALSIGNNLILIRLFQSIIELDLHRFFFWILLTVCAWVLLLVFDGIQNFFKYRAIRIMNNAVRRDMVATILHKDYQSLHRQTTGDYLSFLTNDVAQIEALAWNPFFTCVQCVASVIWGVIALATLHWSLLLAALASAIVTLLLPRLFHQRMQALGAECAQAQASATGHLKDLLGGYDVLRFFGRRDRFTAGTQQASDQIERPKYHLGVIKGFVGEGISAVQLVCQILINVLIGVLSIQGIIIQSALMGGGNLCATVSNGLSTIASLRLSFSASKPYFAKITVQASSAVPAPGQELPPPQDAITLEDVSFGYDPQVPVLDHVSMRFDIGEKYALVGPSGCGKSTLLKILLGCLPDYKGLVRFDGADIRQYTPEQIQAQIAYIDQNIFLFNTTIRENITLGQHFTDEQMEKALRDSALTYDLQRLPNGLDTVVGEDGSNLSGGQKQRIAIARALIHNRSILLMDEGTSALDQENSDVIEESLLNNPKLTLIVVSHHLSEKRKAQLNHIYEL